MRKRLLVPVVVAAGCLASVGAALYVLFMPVLAGPGSDGAREAGKAITVGANGSVRLGPWECKGAEPRSGGSGFSRLYDCSYRKIGKGRSPFGDVRAVAMNGRLMQYEAWWPKTRVGWLR